MSEETAKTEAPVETPAAAPTDTAAPAPAAPAAPATPPPVAKPAQPTPAPAAPKPVVKETQPAPATASSFDVLITNLKAKGTVSEKSLIQAIESYMAAMRPGQPVTDVDGAHHQYTLWTTIRGLIDQVPAEEFAKHWNMLLSFVANNQEEGQVFHDRFVFRFSEHWTRTEADLDAFQRILNLIKLTAKPETRKLTLRQVDLDRTLTKGFTEAGRQKILSFYA